MRSLSSSEPPVGGGAYTAEREIAERWLRAAGLGDQDVTSAIERADKYFKDVLKVTDSTRLFRGRS